MPIWWAICLLGVKLSLFESFKLTLHFWVKSYRRKTVPNFTFGHKTKAKMGDFCGDFGIIFFFFLLKISFPTNDFLQKIIKHIFMSPTSPNSSEAFSLVVHERWSQVRALMYDEWERPGWIWACWTHESVFNYFLEKIVRRKTDFQTKKKKNYSKVATKVAHFCFSFVTKSEIWIFKKFLK